MNENVHAYLGHFSLSEPVGVSQIVVAINKMDTVNWSQPRYLEIVNKLTIFLKQAGFRESDVRYVPCSGLVGINLSKPATDAPELSWYTGPPLINEIGEL